MRLFRQRIDRAREAAGCCRHRHQVLCWHCCIPFLSTVDSTFDASAARRFSSTIHPIVFTNSATRRKFGKGQDSSAKRNEAKDANKSKELGKSLRLPLCRKTTRSQRKARAKPCLAARRPRKHHSRSTPCLHRLQWKGDMRNLDSLPFDVLFEVARYLSLDDVVALGCTSRQLRVVVKREEALCRMVVQSQEQRAFRPRSPSCLANRAKNPSSHCFGLLSIWNPAAAATSNHFLTKVTAHLLHRPPKHPCPAGRLRLGIPALRLRHRLRCRLLAQRGRAVLCLLSTKRQQQQ
ncbi:hypothetical protein IWX49DRAFT_230743 [Phyllosticta citricarpa]